ncbi:unnamed protein product [Rhizophagus irregularis]|nr:unnamed protein product [Rhizophagus irregularis]
MVKKAKTDNGIKVVLKAFIDENSKIENFISNFMKELELLHMVGYHDNINRFLGITKDDIGNYFMVFKHANEGNLRNYLNKKFDSLQWENKIQMAFDITCGLKYLHSKGIIHRHLHSNNILANNDRLLISDFGLSNLMGVLLWEITSGRPPFHDDNVLQDDMKRSNLQNYTGHMSFREEQIEGTPLEFRRLYEKCLNVDPEKRPDINQVYKEILNQSDDLYEEEWIKKKMKEEDICYFEYSKFSNFEEIGKGGFGVVKKAMTDDGNKVALKGLIENSKIRRNVIKTFVKELKNLRLVSHHDNINKFLGISKDHAGNYIMVLGYANEGNLRSYLKVKFDSLEWGDKIRMALDITCGLKCLHSKKIIHRDLHSKNILVNNGRLLIADFGLSKHLTDATSNSMGNRTGITEYIDPRCFRDFKYVRREKSDIYSLGILLWEITSGRPPFHDDNVSQAQDDPEQSNLRYHIGYLNLREKPIDGTPLEYQQLYQKCWDGDPEKRPDVNQVYNEILCQYNADDIHEKHEDFSSSNSSNSHDNLNISSDYSEPYLGSEFD